MDFLNQINQPDVEIFSINFAFKLLFFVVIVGYILYAFLLTIRVRILSETVKTQSGSLAVTITYTHMLIALIGGFLALLVILLA